MTRSEVSDEEVKLMCAHFKEQVQNRGDEKRRGDEGENGLISASCLLSLMNWLWKVVAIKHLVHSLELNTPQLHPTSTFAFLWQ